MRGSRLLATLILPLAAACGGSTTTVTEAPGPRGATSRRDLAGRPAAAHLDLRGRLDDGPPHRHPGEREGQRLHRERGPATGPQARRRRRQLSSRRSRSPATPWTRRGARSRSARTTWCCGRTTTPTRPNFRCRPGRSTARAWCTSAARPIPAALPPRDALKDKIVVYNSGSAGNSLGAPDLNPAGRLGLIAGLAVTGVDTRDRHLRAALPDSAHRGEAAGAGPARRHPAATPDPALPPPWPSSSASRSTSSRPGTTGPAVQGDVVVRRERPGRDQRGRGARGIRSRRCAVSTSPSARTTTPSAWWSRWTTTRSGRTTPSCGRGARTTRRASPTRSRRPASAPSSTARASCGRRGSTRS